MQNITVISSIEKIANNLDKCSVKHTIYAAKKQRIEFIDNKKSYVFYLKQGEVQLHRLIDNLVVLNLEAPMLIGLTSLKSDSYYHFITSKSDCQLVAIEKKIFTDFLDEHNLWESAFDLVCQL